MMALILRRINYVKGKTKKKIMKKKQAVKPISLNNEYVKRAINTGHCANLFQIEKKKRRVPKSINSPRPPPLVKKKKNKKHTKTDTVHQTV